MNTYLETYWQPLLGLAIGVLLIAFYIYLYINRNEKVIPWIAKNIFRNGNMTVSAESLFKVGGSYILMFAGLMIIIALLFLNH